MPAEAHTTKENIMSILFGKLFYPVIHCVSPSSQGGVGHALANTRIAMDNGADGVFLIGHRIACMELSQIYEQVRKQFPNAWIGLNFLDLSPAQKRKDLVAAVRMCDDLNALWMDHLPDSELGRLEIHRTIQTFGGVAFKYIAPNLSGDQLSKECDRAFYTVDVATTSGAETGSPPNVAKLQDIATRLEGRIPLAVASGVSVDNVDLFLPYVDVFLVASSVCERNPRRGNHDYLVPEKVRALADKIHFP